MIKQQLFIYGTLFEKVEKHEFEKEKNIHSLAIRRVLYCRRNLFVDLKKKTYQKINVSFNIRM